MVHLPSLGLLTLASSALAVGPYYANLSWEAPRTLSNWANLTVDTPYGTFVGFYNDTYPNVRQFLRVPYAKVCTTTLHRLMAIWITFGLQPPVGELRWEPPHKLNETHKRIDSTRYGPGEFDELSALQ